jgi:hypothetical protein
VSGEDWRSPERYAGVSGCSAADLAWEFLRRNRDYNDEFAHLGQDAASGRTDAERVRLSRWGLSFRRRSAAHLQRTAGVLAPGPLPAHRHPGARATRIGGDSPVHP